jgi:hypothetical protein
VISLSDVQLQTVMSAASTLDPEKRDLFLQRLASMLKLRGRYGDTEVAKFTTLALEGLAHESAA